jgi:hypothetical protein
MTPHTKSLLVEISRNIEITLLRLFFLAKKISLFTNEIFLFMKSLLKTISKLQSHPLLPIFSSWLQHPL